jgi:uncharacterized protein YbcI
MSGASPTIESVPVKGARRLAEGDMLSLQSGEADLGASGDGHLLGVAIETAAGAGSSTFVRVISDADAVYAVRDNYPRNEYEWLDLSGTTGAQSLAEGGNRDFSVVRNCTAGEETLVRIRPGAHARDRPGGGELNAAIARTVVHIYRNHVGRGPTRAHAFFRGSIVVVLMQNVMTIAERTLADSGQAAAVLAVRHRLQEAMRADLVASVARLTGRSVTASMSAHHIDPDMAAEIFVLDQPVPSGAAGVGPGGVT